MLLSRLLNSLWIKEQFDTEYCALSILKNPLHIINFNILIDLQMAYCRFLLIANVSFPITNFTPTKNMIATMRVT